MAKKTFKVGEIVNYKESGHTYKVEILNIFTDEDTGIEYAYVTPVNLNFPREIPMDMFSQNAEPKAKSHIEFDGSCEDAIRLMKQYGDTLDEAIYGKNENGEDTAISINKDCVAVKTYQHNGWIRTDFYYDDYTVEETYSK